jgi:hypothetical protein
MTVINESKTVPAAGKAPMAPKDRNSMYFRTIFLPILFGLYNAWSVWDQVCDQDTTEPTRTICIVSLAIYFLSLAVLYISGWVDGKIIAPVRLWIQVATVKPSPARYSRDMYARMETSDMPSSRHLNPRPWEEMDPEESSEDFAETWLVCYVFFLALAFVSVTRFWRTGDWVADPDRATNVIIPFTFWLIDTGGMFISMPACTVCLIRAFGTDKSPRLWPGMVGVIIFLTIAAPIILFHGLSIVPPARTIVDLPEKSFLIEAYILGGTWVFIAIFLFGAGYMVWRHRVSRLGRQLKDDDARSKGEADDGGEDGRDSVDEKNSRA